MHAFRSNSNMWVCFYLGTNSLALILCCLSFSASAYLRLNSDVLGAETSSSDSVFTSRDMGSMVTSMEASPEASTSRHMGSMETSPECERPEFMTTSEVVIPLRSESVPTHSSLMTGRRKRRTPACGEQNQWTKRVRVIDQVDQP